MFCQLALAVPALKRLVSNSSLIALVCIILYPCLARGQQTLGSMTGIVTDNSDAVVPKVKVKVRQPRTWKSPRRRSRTVRSILQIYPLALTK